MHSTSLQDPTEGADCVQRDGILLVGIQMIEEGANSSERGFSFQIYRGNGEIGPQEVDVGCSAIGGCSCGWKGFSWGGNGGNASGGNDA